MARRQGNAEEQNAPNPAVLMAQMTAVMTGVNNNLTLLHQQVQQNMNQNQNNNQNQNLEQQGYRGLDEFCRRNPKEFGGGFAPEEAQKWVENLQRIFGGMVHCTDEQKVAFAGYMLVGEAANWWRIARQVMVGAEEAITWARFKERFLEKYFPEDLKTEKEMEFLKLEQGNLTVGEYAAKFEELAKYVPQYANGGNERSKCAKFRDGLKPELKLAFSHLEIHVFATLVNKCRMYEGGLKAKSSSEKSTNPPANHGPVRNLRNGRNDGDGFKAYQGPYGQGNRRIDNRNGGAKSHGGSSNNNNRDRFRNNDRNNSGSYGGENRNNGDNNNNNGGFRNNSNQSGGGQQGVPPHCNRCNRNHYGPNCPYENPNCFNCDKPGHIAKDCREPKRERGSDRLNGN